MVDTLQLARPFRVVCATCGVFEIALEGDRAQNAEAARILREHMVTCTSAIRLDASLSTMGAGI